MMLSWKLKTILSLIRTKTGFLAFFIKFYSLICVNGLPLISAVLEAPNSFLTTLEFKLEKGVFDKKNRKSLIAEDICGLYRNTFCCIILCVNCF